MDRTRDTVVASVTIPISMNRDRLEDEQAQASPLMGELSMIRGACNLLLDACRAGRKLDASHVEGLATMLAGSIEGVEDLAHGVAGFVKRLRPTDGPTEPPGHRLRVVSQDEAR